MTTWLQSWRDTQFEREVAGVRLVGAAIPEADAPTLLAPSGTTQLEARMTDDSGFDKMHYHTAPTFEYESADEAKATVDENGLVTCVYAGNEDTTVSISVTATTAGAQEFTDSVTVNITGDTTPDSVTVAPSTATLAPLDTQQLTATVKNANGDTLAGETVTWDSDDTDVATVDGDGLVTAVGDGTCTVTATSDTNGALTDTCAVTVETP